MIKKHMILWSVSAMFFAYAQDVSTIRNTVDVYSNSSFNGSAKYNAMVGSMGALGGDFSSLNSNPAGIGVSIASEVSATLSIQNSKNTTTLFGKSNNFSIRKGNLGNGGGVIAFKIDSPSTLWKFVNIGANYSTQSIEDYSESVGNGNITYHIPSTNDDLYFNRHAYNRYGNISKMSIALGGNYNNRIYVGVGLNFHGSLIDQYDTATFTSVTNGSTSEYQKQYTPFSEVGNGFSASVGIIGKINPQFRLGASIETPTWWNIERVYDEYENPVDGTYTEERNLSTPMKTTLSVAFVPNKNFAINVDYSLGLTKPKYKVYGDAERELNQFFRDHSKTVSEIKIGAEYRFSGFRLRGGYAFASNPFDNVNLNSFAENGSENNAKFSNLLVAKRNTIGVGVGYDFKSFFIDAAYQNISSEYNSPFLQGSSTHNTGYFSYNYIVEYDASAVSKVKNNRNNFFLTFGWKF